MPEQAEQRRNRRDGAERIQKSLQLVDDVPPRILEPLHHDVACAVPVGEAYREHAAERRVLFERRDELVVDLVILHPVPDLLGELARQDTLLLQGPQPLQDDRAPMIEHKMMGHIMGPPA